MRNRNDITTAVNEITSSDFYLFSHPYRIDPSSAKKIEPSSRTVKVIRFARGNFRTRLLLAVKSELFWGRPLVSRLLLCASRIYIYRARWHTEPWKHRSS